ncbi:hypothetical protein OBV_p-00250 (plasmid) [Oscillibacter valericigenes Sjm18-20]|nr:hypothetical protein OBV_p-00250 [Oscillibacter valericigenes Sjm18-20]
MKALYYKKGCSPEIVFFESSDISILVGGKPHVEALLNGICAIWNENAPTSRDNTYLNRNVFFPKFVNNHIEVIPFRMSSDFIVCGYDNGTLKDVPCDKLPELKAMFGF